MFGEHNWPSISRITKYVHETRSENEARRWRYLGSERLIEDCYH